MIFFCFVVVVLFISYSTSSVVLAASQQSQKRRTNVILFHFHFHISSSYSYSGAVSSMQQKLVVFVSLILDLLAFTLILPLFPKIFDLYASNEHVTSTFMHIHACLLTLNTLIWICNWLNEIETKQKRTTLISWCSTGWTIFGAWSACRTRRRVCAAARSTRCCSAARSARSSRCSSSSRPRCSAPSRTSTDANGSFSSHWLASLLDLRYPTLTAYTYTINERTNEQVGTLISHIIWSMSSVFVVFLISRILGGIFKANVSICIAIMTDISANKDRSSTMALVGIAFSIGFLVGPCIGAVFSSMLSASSAVYIYPSYMAIGLTAINILFVAKFYEETLPVEKRVTTNTTTTFITINLQDKLTTTTTTTK